MSRNYDNWERLVAAVLKREQIWQLCHQDSVSTIYSDYSSSRLDFTLPIPLGSSAIPVSFDLIQPLKQGKDRSTDLVELVQDVVVCDQLYFAKGTQAVVKSLTASKITEDEFEQHMSVLGNCRHDNVATPWAYHFSRSTKLIVYGYNSQGSVFDMLGGGRGTRPNWKSRIRIAAGAARGVAHIHKQSGGTLAHGSIKCSNTFLNSQSYGCVSDFCLPERHKSAADVLSQESDVYSFGLLLLQVCTRASPMQPETWWVSSMPNRRGVDDEVMDEVEKEEFRRTMEIANWCLALPPRDRPSMAQVVLELEKMAGAIPPPPPQLADQGSVHPRHSYKSEDKKRGWDRFLRFVR